MTKKQRLRIGTDGYLCFGKKGRLHRAIWEAFNGPIPEKFDIHHKDGNKLNNSIDNLECLSHSAHLSLHMKTNKHLHDWHKTEEGRKFLGEKAKKLWQDRPLHSLICAQCGKEFKAKQADRAKYCNKRCEEHARRDRGDDLIDRECVICSKTFRVNKYYKTKTCGYACGGILSHIKFK